MATKEKKPKEGQRMSVQNEWHAYMSSSVFTHSSSTGVNCCLGDSVRDSAPQE